MLHFLEKEGGVELKNLHHGVRHHDHDADTREGHAPPQVIGNQDRQLVMGSKPHPPHKQRHEKQADDKQRYDRGAANRIAILRELHQNKCEHCETRRFNHGTGPIHLSPKPLPRRPDEQTVGGEKKEANGAADGNRGSGEIPGRPPTDRLDENAAEHEASREAEGLAKTRAGKSQIAQPPRRNGVAEDADRGRQTHGDGDALHGAEHGQLDVGLCQPARQGEGAEEKSAEQKDPFAAHDISQRPGDNQAGAGGEAVDGERPVYGLGRNAEVARHGGDARGDEAGADARHERHQRQVRHDDVCPGRLDVAHVKLVGSHGHGGGGREGSRGPGRRRPHARRPSSGSV